MECPVCKDANPAIAERQAGDRPRGDYPERPREPGRHERRHRDDEYRGKPRKSFLRDLFG